MVSISRRYSRVQKIARFNWHQRFFPSLTKESVSLSAGRAPLLSVRATTTCATFWIIAPPHHRGVFSAKLATCATFFSSRQWRGGAKSGWSAQHWFHWIHVIPCSDEVSADISEDDIHYRHQHHQSAPLPPPSHYQTQAADLSLGGPDHHHHHPDLYGLAATVRPPVLYGAVGSIGGGGTAVGSSPPLAHHQLYEDSFYTATADTSMDQVDKLNYLILKTLIFKLSWN